MSYVTALGRGLAGLLERTRGWFRNSLHSRTTGGDEDRDDLYEIFLFAPHG